MWREDTAPLSLCEWPSDKAVHGHHCPPQCWLFLNIRKWFTLHCFYSASRYCKSLFENVEKLRESEIRVTHTGPNSNQKRRSYRKRVLELCSLQVVAVNKTGWSFFPCESISMILLTHESEMSHCCTRVIKVIIALNVDAAFHALSYNTGGSVTRFAVLYITCRVLFRIANRVV